MNTSIDMKKAMNTSIDMKMNISINRNMKFKMAATAGLSLTLDLMGKCFKTLLL
jgi:hypothetical protein